MLSLVAQKFKSKRLLLPLAYIICIIISCHYFVINDSVLTKAISLLLIHSKGIRPIYKSNSSFSWSPRDSSTGGPFRFQRSILFRTVQNNSTQDDSWRSNSSEIWASNKDRVISLNATRYYPWIGDDSCEHYFVQFAPNNTFIPRALVAFPGSGSSWLRYLIDTSSGYFTGSIFHDKNLFNSGLLGEMRMPNDGTTVIQKTHHDTLYLGNQKKLLAYVKLSELLFGYRGILLIRNPYDALVSYWNFKKSLNHKGFATKPDLKDKEWSKFARVGIRKWTSLIKNWIMNSMDLMIVQYEELTNNPKKEIIKILEYLEQPVDQQRMKCLVRHLEGPFHRKKIKQSLSIENQDETKFFEEAFEANDNKYKSLTSSSTLYPNTTLTLDLIIQENINEINQFLQENSFPLFLNYVGST